LLIFYGKRFCMHLYRNVYPMNAINTYSSDFLDILFDGRNKDYGAYDLRRSQDRRVRNAIIGTASIAIVIIGGYVLSNRLMAADMHTRFDATDRTTIIRDLTEEVKKVPVTPPPPSHPSTPPPAAPSIKSVTPTITEDDKVRPEDEVPKLDSIGNKTIALSNNVGTEDGVDAGSILGVSGGNGVVVVGPTSTGPDHSTTFSTVEIPPSFPGGMDALSRFLSKNIRYPHMASENGIQGRINVQFIVDWEGNITGVQTTGANVGAGLEEEAMRVVKMMPKWKPGRQNGQSVNVRYNLPVGFHLNNE
jgi:protein TonB